jgi:hypothetical protein
MPLEFLSNTLLAYWLFFLLCSTTCFASIKFQVSSPQFIGLILYVTGLLFLPNQDYATAAPAVDYRVEFAYWFSGGALPTNQLFTKAFVVPTSIAIAFASFSRKLFADLNWCASDLVVLLWICNPLLSLLGNTHITEALTGLIYLAGTWGAPWLLGRILLRREADFELLIKVISITSITLLPLACLEFVFSPFLYDSLYQPHPFSVDGAKRYFGHRPVLFFEHGNQFGLWVAIAALCSTWAWRSKRNAGAGNGPSISAALLALMALASQSIGALALAISSGVVLHFWQRINRKLLIVTCLAVITLGSSIYVSGIIPIERVVRNTEFGQKILDVFRASGRASLPWRISQDLKTMRLIDHSKITGSGRWDWWRPAGIRPWGLHQLTLGQFGVLGLLLSCIVLTGSSILAFWKSQENSFSARTHELLAIVVLISAFDAILNSFIFYPALLISGGMATFLAHKRQPPVN